MNGWFEPVKEIGNVVVFGERHREPSSRRLFNQIWQMYDFSAVCVEAPPSVQFRNDGGGAIGAALTNAETEGVPRYYVDEPQDDVIEAFGSRREAGRYLKNLEEKYPTHEDGFVNQNHISEIREDVYSKYGSQSYDLLFTNRERKMAGRARWIANERDGRVILVVGAAHYNAIMNFLQNDVEQIKVSDRRIRDNERNSGGPWSGLFSELAPNMDKSDLKNLFFKLKGKLQTV